MTKRIKILKDLSDDTCTLVQVGGSIRGHVYEVLKWQENNEWIVQVWLKGAGLPLFEDVHGEHSGIPYHKISAVNIIRILDDCGLLQD